MVHCAMGINRSAAVCAGYLMMTTHATLFEVLKTLKRKRRIVLTNHGFQRQLVRYAGARGLLDDLPPQSREEENGTTGDKYLNGSSSLLHDDPYHDLDFLSTRRSIDEDRGSKARARPLSDSFDTYSTSRLYGNDIGGPSEPRYTYQSAGRRTHICIPVASSSSAGSMSTMAAAAAVATVSSSSRHAADDYSPGNSIFERYMMKQKTYFHK